MNNNKNSWNNGFIKGYNRYTITKEGKKNGENYGL